MILLDTCVIIWNALEPSRLTPKAKKAIITTRRTGGMMKAPGRGYC